MPAGPGRVTLDRKLRRRRNAGEASATKDDVTTSVSEPETIDVDALIGGDEKAFEALVRQESPRLYRMIRRMLGDEDEARSVLQETFLQAFRGLNKFRRESRVSTWIYGIALNQARTARRKMARNRMLNEQDIERLQPEFRLGVYAERPGAWDPYQELEAADRVRIVRDAIDRLPEAYREVLILRDMNEMETSEVAALLNVTEGALRVRVHRARQALRTLLQKEYRSL
jgi:RNA polymerase sigma-70 factor, ECF subfamily